MYTVISVENNGMVDYSYMGSTYTQSYLEINGMVDYSYMGSTCTHCHSHIYKNNGIIDYSYMVYKCTQSYLYETKVWLIMVTCGLHVHSHICRKQRYG